MTRPSRFTLEIHAPAAVTTSDARGKPQTGAATLTKVKGNLSMLSARERERAAQFGENIVAAAGVPHGTAVDYKAQVVLAQPADGFPHVPLELRGTYEVAAVQYTRPRLRLLLRRTSP